MSTQEREDSGYSRHYELTPEAKKILKRGGSLVGVDLSQHKKEQLPISKTIKRVILRKP